MSRKLFGVDLGGSTGLPLAPVGDSGFDEAFRLSTSEPARRTVLAWMQRPGVKQQVEGIFAHERLAMLTPLLDSKGSDTFLGAVVRPFREEDLQPANVRSMLEQLERIAKSLETQELEPN